MRTMLGPAAAVLLLGCVGAAETGFSQEAAEYDDRDPDHNELARRVASTSIIWIDPAYVEKNFADKEIVKNSANLFAKEVGRSLTDRKDKVVVSALYNAMHGFALPVSPSTAEAALDRIAHLKPIENPKNDNERAQNDSIARLHELGSALSVTPDMIVSISDADCSDTDIRPLSDGNVPNTPAGVSRVRGGTTPKGGYFQKVWILDSGLDNSSRLIQVDTTNASNCHVPDPSNKDGWTCDSSRGYRDKIGHGTMLAGIVAGKGSKVTGVAPGATIVPVKIFGDKPEVELSGPPLKALDHVKQHADAGDIINMSWGAAWLEGMYAAKNQLETVMGYPAQLNWPLPPQAGNPGWIGELRAMAMDKMRPLKFVVAAGNIDLSIRPSQVGFVAPAVLGSYPKPNVGEINDDQDGCRICTVSAVDDTDRFWWDDKDGMPVGPGSIAVYGSDYGRSPPDFAEPGVDVWSLWPRERPGTNDPNRANKCSGTSFAAAHLSGILVRSALKAGAVRDPEIDGRASGDPDVVGIDDPGDPEKDADPIGVATR